MKRHIAQAARYPLASAAFAAAAVALVLVTAQGLPGSKDRTGLAATNAAPSKGRIQLIQEQHLPNVLLTDHTGRKVRFYDDLVKDQVVAINFLLVLCANNCPTSTSNLVEAQKSLIERQPHPVRFLSITLSPETDTPERLADYARAHGVGPNWLFLTGRREDIELLRRGLGAYELDPDIDRDPVQHTGLVIFGNEPKGRWKAISSLSNPVRIRQAIERIILDVTQWTTGEAAINEVPPSESNASLVELPLRKSLSPATTSFAP